MIGERTDDWVSESVAAACSEQEVPDGVSSILQASLDGAMRARPLRDKERDELAQELLAMMSPSVKDGQDE